MTALNAISGLKNDFDNLLMQFTDSGSVRFEEFSKIWKEMQMSMIFSGRNGYYYLIEFMDAAFRLALNLCLPPHSFQVRVGATYLLYALYFKQPAKPPVSIRITSSQWRNILELQQEVKQQQHLDIEFVIAKLRFHKAFDFVATPTPLYPEMKDLFSESPVDTAVAEKFKDQSSLLSGVLLPDSIDQLSAIHDQYDRMKCALAGPSATTPGPSLNVIQSSLIQNITRTMAAHEEWRRKRAQKATRRKKGESGLTTSESETESESEQVVKQKATKRNIRAEIKERAFSQIASPSKSRRHRRILSDNSTESPTKQKTQSLHNSTSSTIEESSPAEDEEEAVDIGATVRAAFLNMPQLSSCQEDIQVKTKGRTGRKKKTQLALKRKRSRMK